MTDYRALCAELVSNLQLIVSYLESDECGTSDSEELIDRAHTLLAQPEAESPATQLAARPLLEKVARMGDQAAAWLEANPPGQLVAIEPRGCPTPGACSCVELVAQPEPEGLTEIALQMLGTIESMELIIPEITDTIRKALEQGNPTPQPPADGEVGVAASLIELRSTVMALDQMGMHVAAQRVERAADLLEHQHPQPVAVSERLPGTGDCDELDNCWQWEPDINGHHPLGEWKLLHRDWLSDPDGDTTHWLPANALPTPGAPNV